MPARDNTEKRSLVHAIVISEKPIDSESEQGRYLFEAFPEQVTLDVKDGQLRVVYKSTFSVLWLTYDKWVKPDHKNALMACIGSLEKGRNILPPDWTKLSASISDDERRVWREGTRLTNKGLQFMIGGLLFQSRGSDVRYATSPEFIRTWSIIDGPEVKEGPFGKPRPSRILAVSIYSA